MGLKEYRKSGLFLTLPPTFTMTGGREVTLLWAVIFPLQIGIPEAWVETGWSGEGASLSSSTPSTVLWEPGFSLCP